MTKAIIWKLLTSKMGRYFALAVTLLGIGATFFTRYGNARAKKAHDKLLEKIENADEENATKILDRVERGRAKRVREPYNGPFRDE